MKRSTADKSIMSRTPKRPPSRGKRILLSSAIWMGALLIAGEAALILYPGLMLLPSASRLTYSPYCSIWQGVRDGNLKLERAELATEIRDQSHVVQTEGKFKLWSTPRGEYWVPDTSDSILSILLAQQETRIYGDADTGGVRKGDIVLDGGAHIGTYVRTALEAGAKTVVAIDPSPKRCGACIAMSPKKSRLGRSSSTKKAFGTKKRHWCSTPMETALPVMGFWQRVWAHAGLRTSPSPPSIAS
jgi:hypothetical protein